MNKILEISNDPLQIKNITLQDGSTLILTLYFVPMQLGWFINDLTYGTFKLTGMRIRVGYNMLHQYRNKIPFGIACFNSLNVEPFSINDFSSGNTELYILNSTEVARYTSYLSV